MNCSVGSNTKDRVRKSEVNDKEQSENSDGDIICPNEVPVSTRKD